MRRKLDDMRTKGKCVRWRHLFISPYRIWMIKNGNSIDSIRMGTAVAVSEWEERNKKKRERVRVGKKIAIEHQVKTRIFACWDLLRLWLDDISHPLDTVWLFEFVTNPNDGILICFAFNARKHKMYVFGKYSKTPVAPRSFWISAPMCHFFLNDFRAPKHAFIF